MLSGLVLSFPRVPVTYIIGSKFYIRQSYIAQ